MTSLMATISAVRTGRVRTHQWDGKEVLSAGLKQQRAGQVLLGPLGLEDDEQADRKNHGGPDKAVLVYPARHYPRWRTEEGLDLPVGAFFENITLAAPDEGPGPDETSVVLGETWRLGQAIVQVSQPRSPCYKLARRWRIDDLVLRVQRTGWSGWYVRVLEPGLVAAGDGVELLDRPAGSPTLAEIARVVNVDKHDLEGARRLLQVDGLPERWRTKLRDRLAGGVIDDDSARING